MDYALSDTCDTSFPLVLSVRYARSLRDTGLLTRFLPVYVTLTGVRLVYIDAHDRFQGLTDGRTDLSGDTLRESMVKCTSVECNLSGHARRAQRITVPPTV